MPKPLLIIVNGLPASGKTTLAKRLGADLALPVFSRDSIDQTLHNVFKNHNIAAAPAIGLASFKLLYHFAGCLLAVRQPLIVEQFFGRPDLRTAEFLQLQQLHAFEPFQIVCRTDGEILVARFMARLQTFEEQPKQVALEWLEQNRQRMLKGELAPLALGGEIIEVDTTSSKSFNYAELLHNIQIKLGDM